MQARRDAAETILSTTSVAATFIAFILHMRRTVTLMVHGLRSRVTDSGMKDGSSVVLATTIAPSSTSLAALDSSARSGRLTRPSTMPAG